MYRLKKHIEHFFYKRFCSIRILFVTSNSLIVIFLTLSIRLQIPLSWRFTDWLFRKLLLKRKCCHFCLFRIQSLVSNVITPWIIRINQTFSHSLQIQFQKYSLELRVFPAFSVALIAITFTLRDWNILFLVSPFRVQSCLSALLRRSSTTTARE